MTKTAPPRSMRLLVIGSAILAAIAAAAFYLASQQKQRIASDADAIHVTVTSKGCEPNALTVPAGKRSFKITNASDRPVEWEILQGVMVVEERENIAPGFSQTLSATLAPGDYEITCGLLSNPRGTLHVTPSEEADAGSRPTLRALIGPLSEYKVFIAQQSAAMVESAQALAAAIKAGDLDKAQALYLAARLPYKRIEQLAYRFSDLENAVDPVADYLEKREDDPAFTGYHRLEYGLFKQQSLDGLAPIADKLVTDVTALKDRLRALKPAPSMLTDSGADLAEQLAQSRIAVGESHYANTDLDDLDANLAGIEKTTGLLKPVLDGTAPRLSAEIDQALAGVRAELGKFKSGDGYVAYDKVDAAARQRVSDAFQTLAAALRKLSDAIGVS